MNDDVVANLRAQIARLADANAFEALGVGYDADGAAVRAAFLAATKKYHPSRFARMDRAVVRLANEVFLQLKDAYTLLRDDAKRDALSEKYAPASSRPASSSGASGPSSARTSRSPSSPRGKTEAGTGVSGRFASRSVRQVAVSGRVSGAARARTVPGAAPVSGSGSARGRSGASSGARSASGRPSAAARTGSDKSPRTTRGVGRIPRPAPPSERMSQRELAEFADSAHRTGKERIDAVRAAITDTVRQRGEKFETALSLNRAGNHEEARKLLQQVAVDEPKEKKYRVYLHYVWAQEHEHAERYEDARAEYQRALNIDPTFKRAHEALGRLEADKKGFFKKLFSR